MKNPTPWILIRIEFDEVHDCWVAYYRDHNGLLQIERSISKPRN